MLQNLDYILDYDNNYWIINYMKGNTIFGKTVFLADEFGDRYNHITKLMYKKEYGKIQSIPSIYQKSFHPRDFFLETKNILSGIWKDFVSEMNLAGIPDENIGIIGSNLIGFDVIKDIDFVIYEKENLFKYIKHNDLIKKHLGVTYITQDHVNYQEKKYRNDYNPNTDLRQIVERNWSGIQISEGILSTPRFIDTENMIVPERTGEDKVIHCKVISGITSSCYPRYAMVLYHNDIYKIITPFWMFQSFAKDGEMLEIHGNVNDKDKIILLDNDDDYLKYL